MKIRRLMGSVLVAALLAASSAWADRGYGRHTMPGGHRLVGGSYGYQHFHHGHARSFWGPLGLVVGSALLYSAVQPRTVYYESRTIYAPAPLPPPVTVYYTPQTVVRSDTIYVAPSEQTVTTIVPVPSLPGSSAGLSAHSNAQPGPGASGAQWWYLCRNPSGYYPHIMECPSGWEKVAPSLPPER